MQCHICRDPLRVAVERCDREWAAPWTVEQVEAALRFGRIGRANGRCIRACRRCMVQVLRLRRVGAFHHWRWRPEKKYPPAV